MENEKPEAICYSDNTRRIVGTKGFLGRKHDILALEKGRQGCIFLLPFDKNIQVVGQEVSLGSFTEVGEGDIVILPNEEWFTITPEVLSGADPIVYCKTTPVPEKETKNAEPAKNEAVR